MEKESINHKSSLLIGLLSLNTLASCANTRKELGFNLKKSFNTYLFSVSNILKEGFASALPSTAVTHTDHSSLKAIRADNLSSGLSSGMPGSIQDLNKSEKLDEIQKTFNLAQEKFLFDHDTNSLQQINKSKAGLNSVKKAYLGRFKRSSNGNSVILDTNNIDDLFRKMVYTETFNLKKLKKLVEQGLSIHVQNSKGANLIMVAIMRADVEMLNFVIKHGADFNVALPDGRTPLSVAKKLHNYYKRRVSYNVKDYSGAPAWAKADPFDQERFEAFQKIVDFLESKRAMNGIQRF